MTRMAVIALVLCYFAGRPRIIPKIPASSSDIPKQIPYLLIGGGTASFAAFRAIKSSDPTAKVGNYCGGNLKNHSRF